MWRRLPLISFLLALVLWLVAGQLLQAKFFILQRGRRLPDYKIGGPVLLAISAGSSAIRLEYLRGGPDVHVPAAPSYFIGAAQHRFGRNPLWELPPYWRWAALPGYKPSAAMEVISLDLPYWIIVPLLGIVPLLRVRRWYRRRFGPPPHGFTVQT